MYRRAAHDLRFVHVFQRVMPLLVDLRRVFTAQTQGCHVPRRAVHSRGDPEVELFAAAVAHVFKQKHLPPGVFDAAVLKPHERHQLGVFVHRAAPGVKTTAPLKVFQIGAKIFVVGSRHGIPFTACFNKACAIASAD